MNNYLSLLSDILQNGEDSPDRTGTGTKRVFGRQLRFNLQEGFPAITTKKLAWKAVVGELIWFLKGSTDERELAEITYGSRSGQTTIWTANAKTFKNSAFDGDLGKIYGYQWRNFNGVDQLSNLIGDLKNNPFSRRHILSSWNPKDIQDMALPPCHVLAQFYVSSRYELSCHLYQRSTDVFLGLPFNIASYSLLTHMLAADCGYNVGELVWSGGDIHIYNNHIEQVKEQLTRTPYALPKLKFIKKQILSETYNVNDFVLTNYNHYDSIKAPMAV